MTNPTQQEAIEELNRRGLSLNPESSNITRQEAIDELKRRGVQSSSVPLWKEIVSGKSAAQLNPQLPDRVYNVGTAAMSEIFQIPPQDMPVGMPDITSPEYKTTKDMSGIAPYMALGELEAPYDVAMGASKAGRMLAGPLKAALYSGYGALTSPKDREIGAALGGIGVPIGGAVTKLGAHFANLIPEDLFKNIMKKLTRGSGIKGNLEKIGAKIQSLGKSTKERVIKKYNDVFKAAHFLGIGHNTTLPNFKSSYEQLLDDSPSALDSLHKHDRTLLENLHRGQTSKEWDPVKALPGGSNIEDAHWAQSMLGKNIKKLKYKNTTQADNAAIDLEGLQKQLKNDMRNHLAKKGLNKSYDEATDFYQNNYRPYLNLKSMKEVATGDEDILKNPSNVFSKQPQTKIHPQTNLPTNQSLNTLFHHDRIYNNSSELQDRLLADSLKKAVKTSGKLDVDKAIDTYNGLLGNEKANLISPSSEKMFQDLGEKSEKGILRVPWGANFIGIDAGAADVKLKRAGSPYLKKIGKHVLTPRAIRNTKNAIISLLLSEGNQ